MIKLSKRLDTISSLVPHNSRVMDIGCDHGLLSIYLCEKNISAKVIATDINKNALQNAIDNIKKNKLESKIETRLGNGLDVLNEEDEIDTLIISGMGAHTIVGILKSNIKKLPNIKTIVIQSNNKLEFLRHEVIKINYLIADEKMIEENNKIYTIIKFVKGRKKYNKKELFFGPIMMKENSAIFKKNNEIELSKLKLVLNMLPKKNILARIKIKQKINMYK